MDQYYYDINNNRVFVRGVKDFIQTNSNQLIFKKLIYPTVLENLYYINEYGIVINTVANAMVETKMNQGFPCVNLSTNNDGIFNIEKFRIVDLVAYNFIRNSKSYLERGCIAINKNGIVNDNHYTNIAYTSNGL